MTSIVCLSGAAAQAANHEPDVIESDDIYDWALRLSHEDRIAALQRLGARTDVLWIGHLRPAPKAVAL